MGFWSKKELDAIDRICESIRSRWWEWSAESVQFDNDPETVASGLRHISGVRVCWFDDYPYNGAKSRHRVAATVDDTTWVNQTPADSDRLWFAYQDWFAAKATAKKTDYGPTAKALAQAIIDGHTDAVNGLMDLLRENGHDPQ